MSLDGISDTTYKQIVGIVYRNSRINLGAERHNLVVGRLAKRCRELRLQTFENYCQLLTSGHGKAELTHLIDLISTNHTHFFREEHHFDFVTNTILPEFKANPRNSVETFRCWSAAASSGEEAYSLAITLEEYARRFGRLLWRMQATDISSRVIESAKEGIFETSKLKLPSPALHDIYFQKGIGESAGLSRVRDAQKEKISFYQANLFQETLPFKGDMHLIFCRNVMIYFDTVSQQHLVQKLVSYLRPGGYLIFGTSESLMGINHSLRSLGRSIYKRES
jgi:chemotaxis protein methyltransferase CheR